MALTEFAGGRFAEGGSFGSLLIDLVCGLSHIEVVGNARGKTVNVHDAKTHLSKLLERVEGGEEIVIARAGQPVARLVPFARPGKRTLGLDAGQGFIADDFDGPLPDDVRADFER